MLDFISVDVVLELLKYVIQPVEMTILQHTWVKRVGFN